MNSRDIWPAYLKRNGGLNTKDSNYTTISIYNKLCIECILI